YAVVPDRSIRHGSLAASMSPEDRDTESPPVRPVAQRPVGPPLARAVVTEEFLAHQLGVGNDLTSPMPQYGFPGLHPGDRWCVVAVRWLQAYHDGVAAPVLLASTSQRALEIVPLEALREHAVDVPPDLSTLR
ncbi:MAG: uncharacterized protein QOC59_1475, partial [Microbacteriaceae bacterium]|nr:uncharacterized protein [Microbacteriaceae bacterium]